MKRVAAVFGLLVGLLALSGPSSAATAVSDARPHPVTAQPSSVDVVGLAGLDASKVQAVVLNVTVVTAGADLFVTVWPSGQPRPDTSSVNVRAGQTRANLVITAVGADGKIQMATGGAYADVLIDVQGWFAKGGAFTAIGPNRLIDTRPTRSRLKADQVVDVATGLAQGSAAVVNLTGVDAGSAGFLTAWPTGSMQPTTSNLNLDQGDTFANTAIVAVGAGGKLSFSASMPVDLVVDLVGSAQGEFRAIGPSRLSDSRSAGQRLVADGVVSITAGAKAGDALVVNLTATGPVSGGFVTGWPTGSVEPSSSNVNAGAGQTVPNLAVIPVGVNGQISLRSSMATHLIVDGFGILPGGGSYHAVAPRRLLDTRAPVLPGSQVRHGFPIAAGTNVGYATTHANYRATDIFAACGTPILSPVDGVIAEVRRVDQYSPSNPATFGGRSVAVVGDDGVRYYGSHYDVIDDATVVGTRVSVGTRLGTMGKTGDTSVCHLHFGLSVPCPGSEWSVRRGLVWPYPYLDDWRAGRNTSPQIELNGWRADHPSGCWDAMNDPYASSATGP